MKSFFLKAKFNSQTSYFLPIHQPKIGESEIGIKFMFFRIEWFPVVSNWSVCGSCDFEFGSFDGSILHLISGQHFRTKLFLHFWKDVRCTTSWKQVEKTIEWLRHGLTCRLIDKNPERCLNLIFQGIELDSFSDQTETAKNQFRIQIVVNARA